MFKILIVTTYCREALSTVIADYDSKENAELAISRLRNSPDYTFKITAIRLY